MPGSFVHRNCLLAQVCSSVSASAFRFLDVNTTAVSDVITALSIAKGVASIPLGSFQK